MTGRVATVAIAVMVAVAAGHPEPRSTADQGRPALVGGGGRILWKYATGG
jgi:hypothetical protein